MVTATFQPESVELDTTFWLLYAHIKNLDLNMALALYVNLVTPEYTLKERDMHWHLTIQKIRRINHPSDLFQINSVAG